jgi:hypothetical protein
MLWLLLFYPEVVDVVAVLFRSSGCCGCCCFIENYWMLWLLLFYPEVVDVVAVAVLSRSSGCCGCCCFIP